MLRLLLLTILLPCALCCSVPCLTKDFLSLPKATVNSLIYTMTSNRATAECISTPSNEVQLDLPTNGTTPQITKLGPGIATPPLPYTPQDGFVAQTAQGLLFANTSKFELTINGTTTSYALTNAPQSDSVAYFYSAAMNRVWFIYNSTTAGKQYLTATVGGATSAFTVSGGVVLQYSSSSKPVQNYKVWDAKDLVWLQLDTPCGGAGLFSFSASGLRLVSSGSGFVDDRTNKFVEALPLGLKLTPISGTSAGVSYTVTQAEVDSIAVVIPTSFASRTSAAPLLVLLASALALMLA